MSSKRIKHLKFPTDCLLNEIDRKIVELRTLEGDDPCRYCFNMICVHRKMIGEKDES
jgi:hypothetical protein